MKKIIPGICLVFFTLFVHAQNGLENIIVEKYYISDAADAAGSVGALPAGSVTYRVYADMLPGYKFQALYGINAPEHLLRIATTTSFFNNEDRGAVTPSYTKAQTSNNTVMLDSWFSVGAACDGNFGILKTEDNGVANVVNANGILQNANPAAGIPLTVQDGLIAGSQEAVTFVGLTSELNVFGAVSGAGNLFTTNNGSVASVNGSVGPTAANKVLVGQFTTHGVFSFELNVQIGTPTGGTQNYVARNPEAGEIQLVSLVYPLNIAPSVAITAPSPGASFITGDVIAVSANATDTDGTVSSVEFFMNGASIGTDAVFPYQINWTGAAGTDTLTAVATDDLGAKTTSEPVVIQVVNNAPPAVIITSPSPGSSYFTGDVVAIEAHATDGDGTVVQVQFFVDGVSIGTDADFPYTADYNANVPGTYAITAVATDNRGAETASGPVVIHVLNRPPAVSITAPANNAGFITGDVVSIEAVASDIDGTISSVEFFVNGVSIGIDFDAPFQASWNSVAGAASLTSVATDNEGAQTTSAIVTIAVRDNGALQPFTPGNFVVYRVGDGNGFLVNTGNPVFIDEYTTGGSLVQSIPLPSSPSGANHALVASGNASSEGFISTSEDGHSLFLTGYDGASATALPGTSSASKNRVVGKIDALGNINTTTALADFSDGSNPRTVASNNGTDIWVGGAAGGIRYTTLGSAASTQISTALTSVRQLSIVDGQLYASTNQGSSVRVGAVGSGTPQSPGQTITALPGLPVNAGSPVGFFFADLNENVEGKDVLYVADEGGTVMKYSLVSGAWTFNGSVPVSGARGLIGSVSGGGSVTLYASAGSGSAVGGGAVYTLTDHTGYNSAISATVSAIAAVPDMTAFRGIAFAPVPCDPVAIVAQPQSPDPLCDSAGTAVFHVAVNGSGSFTYQWQENSVDIANGGAYSGVNTATLTITNPALLLSGKKYRCMITNCYGGNIIFTDNVATLTVNLFPEAVITPGGNTTFCLGDSVLLSAAAGIGYSYSWSDGASTQSVFVKDAGTYFVNVTNDNGCVAISGPVIITLNPLPVAVINVGGPASFCPGGSVLLTASSGAGNAYSWSTGATTQAITVSAAGSYSVKITNPDGCSAISSSLPVIIHTLPSDINRDGITNNDDFLLLIARFNQACSGCPEDIDHDGIVRNEDFLMLLTQFNQSCQ